MQAFRGQPELCLSIQVPHLGSSLQVTQWVYDWHINKYGLKALAETNLADFIKTVQKHCGASLRLQAFAQLTGCLPKELDVRSW